MGFRAAQACPPLALSPVRGSGVCLPRLRHRGASSNVTETPPPPNLTSLPPRQERRENHGVRGSLLGSVHTPRRGRPSLELRPGRWARGRTTYKPSAQDPAWSADVLDHSGPPTAKMKQRGALTPERAPSERSARRLLVRRRKNAQKRCPRKGHRFREASRLIT